MNSIQHISLGHLADPDSEVSEVNLNTYNVDSFVEMFSKMCTIRAAERKLAEARRNGFIGGPVHLGVGQEAVAVGVTTSLRPSDRVFGAHRSHSHFLALGGSLHSLFAEVLGKNTGASKGMGGSMHLWDQKIGFYGSVPIVSGTVSLAVGAGLAAKLQNSGDVSVAYFGDGAVEEGVVHESLNLARMLNAPTLFVVENNLFASHMHISLRQPSNATARFAQANLIPYKIVDGNNIVAIAEAARDFIEAARLGQGPAFLEAVTYRWYGHVDWREDIDVGVNRSTEELKSWRARDPIARLRVALIDAKVWSEQKDIDMQEVINKEIEDAWNLAVNDPYPEKEVLLSRVYAN